MYCHDKLFDHSVKQLWLQARPNTSMIFKMKYSDQILFQDCNFSLKEINR